MAQVPTLLVGVGGIGCRAVNQVYDLIPKDRRETVAVHGFDTDVGDIQRCDRIAGEITQTSPACTVGDYLNRADPSVREWFPAENAEVRRKLFTLGAGQIRAVSRLAYYASLETGKAHDLKKKLTWLFRQRPEDVDWNLRVMLVGSVAGGTGSGMFVQVALWLRWLIEEEFGRRALIRGCFLLPDALVETNVITGPTQIANVRANAYASMKEVNALMQATGAADGVTIELEYMPEQRDRRTGRPSTVIPPETLPFDFMFLFDFENSRGQNLVGFDAYQRQLVNTTYIQLFSPMADAQFSREDNDILELIRQDGRSRYGSAGVARLVYPYEDILRYCALEWSVASLTGQWIRLDAAIEEERRQREKDLENGINRPELVTAERYTGLLRGLASGESPEPFFQRVYRTAHTASPEGRLGDPKSQVFVEAVDRAIEEAIAGDPSVRLPDDALPDVTLLGKREHALGQVSNFELTLAVYEDRIRKFVTEARTSLVNRIVAQDMHDPALCSGEGCRLNTALLLPEPLHPIAVRFVLYEVQLRLEKALQQLADENRGLLKAIGSYRNAYDDRETPEIESAEDRLRASLERGGLTRLWGKQFKEFIADYEAKSREQLRRLEKYRLGALKEHVYAGVLDAVRVFLAQWERYFRNLQDVRGRLLSERNKLASQHDEGADDTLRYAYASKAAKAAIWDGIRHELAGAMLPVDISRQIYLGQYRRLCARRAGAALEEEGADRTDSAFRADVVAWCEAQLRKEDSLDLDLFSAIREEAEAQHADVQRHVQSKVEEVAAMAWPLAMIPPQRRWASSWGVHPMALASLSGQQQAALFGTDSVTSDAALSKYELWRYVAAYGLTVADLPKFAAGGERGQRGGGAYYLAYRNRIDQLVNQGNTVTPHLDKRWHLPAYMPDLNPTAQLADLARIDRAFLVGIAHGFLVVSDVDGRSIWMCKGGTGFGRQPVLVAGNTVRGAPHLLHDALALNPSVVDRVLIRAAEADEAGREQHPGQLELQPLWKKLTESNLIETLARFPGGDPARGDLPAKLCGRLLPELMRLVSEFAEHSLGVSRPHERSQKCIALLKLYEARIQGQDQVATSTRDEMLDVIGAEVERLERSGN